MSLQRKCFIGWVAAVFLIFLANEVWAAKIQLHLTSKHSESCTCNEENWGIGYISDGPGTRFVGGYYTNSHWKDSLYVGANWKVYRWASVSIVGISGYQGVSDSAKGEVIFPVPLLHIDFMPTEKVSPVLTMAPTKDGGVVLFSLGFDL